MKHYHNKHELDDSDVKYAIVADNDIFRLDFKKVETNFSGIEIFQGVKIWLNRCKLIIDNQIVPTNQIIVWKSKEPKKSKVAGTHFHLFVADSLTFQITETVEVNPNLGIFNVWTTDNKRCYEFTERSFIEDTKKSNTTKYNARHGWTKDNKPTIEFEITKT
jgi:hypothetical protein